jgi:LmbE family N-acetylglucosaminyl deacetylase
MHTVHRSLRDGLLVEQQAAPRGLWRILLTDDVLIRSALGLGGTLQSRPISGRSLMLALPEVYLGLVGDLLAILLPHLVFEGDRLVCRLGRRASRQLSPAEARILKLAARPASLEAIESVHPGARQLLDRFASDDCVRYIEQREPGVGDPLLVIEPHADDAVLSVGGRLLTTAGKRAIHIVTVVDRSNYTSNWETGATFLPTEVVTRMRRRESELVALVLGASHETVGLDDAPLRMCPEAYWDGRTALSAVERDEIHRSMDTFRAEPQTLERLRTAIARVLARVRPTEVLLPMGVGGHPDHQMTARVGLELCGTSAVADRVSLYPEVPYLVMSPQEVDSRLAALRSDGFDCAPTDEPIALSEKISLAQLYSSQYGAVDPQWLVAASGDAARPVERRYEIAPKGLR